MILFGEFGNGPVGMLHIIRNFRFVIKRRILGKTEKKVFVEVGKVSHIQAGRTLVGWKGRIGCELKEHTHQTEFGHFLNIFNDYLVCGVG